MRPRSGDEGREEKAAAAAAAATAATAAATAAAAAKTEIRGRVFCNYPTLLKMIITLLRVWNVFGPHSYYPRLCFREEFTRPSAPSGV